MELLIVGACYLFIAICMCFMNRSIGFLYGATFSSIIIGVTLAVMMTSTKDLTLDKFAMIFILSIPLVTITLLYSGMYILTLLKEKSPKLFSLYWLIAGTISGIVLFYVQPTSLWMNLLLFYISHLFFIIVVLFLHKKIKNKQKNKK